MDNIYHRRSVSEPTYIPIRNSMASSHSVLTRPPLLMVASNPDSRIIWIHSFLGAASLLGWNAMITATPYFISRLDEDSLKSTFGSYLTMSLTAAGFGFIAHATLTSKESPSFFRIRWSTTSLAILMLLLTISTFIPLSSRSFFFFVIITGVLQAAGTSYLSTSLIALASLFGPLVVQAVMLGQGLIGIIISIVQLISVAVSLDDDDVPISAPITTLLRRIQRTGIEKSATLFFVFNTIFLCFGILAHAWLVRLPIYRTIVIPFEAGKVMDQEEERERLVGGDIAFDEFEPVEKVDIVAVTKTNWKYNVAVAYVFVVTLAVFPPITTSILSVHPPETSILANPLMFNAIHFLIFNLGDCIGKYICAFQWFQIWDPKRLLFLSMARTAFIPIFLACNVQRPGETGSPFINSDIAYMTILLFFGITNGHVSSLCMMAAGSLEHNKWIRREQVDTAATVTQFCLNVGLLLGSIASFGVRAKICDCNPFVL